MNSVVCVWVWWVYVLRERARDSLSCVALSLPLSLASCLVGLRAPVPSVGDLQVSPQAVVT